MPNPNLALQQAADMTDRLPGSTENAAAIATVALAFEQQTANLIAYMQSAYMGGLAYRPSPEVLKSIQANVEERLGLV